MHEAKRASAISHAQATLLMEETKRMCDNDIVCSEKDGIALEIARKVLSSFETSFIGGSTLRGGSGARDRGPGLKRSGL